MPKRGYFQAFCTSSQALYYAVFVALRRVLHCIVYFFPVQAFVPCVSNYLMLPSAMSNKRACFPTSFCTTLAHSLIHDQQILVLSLILDLGYMQQGREVK